MDDYAQVAKYQLMQLEKLKMQQIQSQAAIQDTISSSEELLKKQGITLPEKREQQISLYPRSEINLPDWDDLVMHAYQEIPYEVQIQDFFTEEERQSQQDYLKALQEEFNQMHRLDLVDWSIPALAGILSGIIDIVLCGMPTRSRQGTSAGPLTDFVRRQFESRFPPEEMERLGHTSSVKVPYDAQDNRQTVIPVEGLSSFYHRLLQPGHDPILGFIVGTLDVLNGTMTTIDKKGHIAVQVIDAYAGRKETELFAAFARVLRHLKSDVTTSMGLPAPFMSLFNLFQFGSIGEYNQTVAEIVQGMYYEGYDFIHFCGQSLPVMLTEVIVRVAYTLKRVHEGYSLRESLPTDNRLKHPKLGTELFIAHTAATAINTGKILASQNPLAINYPQWISFAYRSLKQIKWLLWEKPELRLDYVQEHLDIVWEEIRQQAIFLSE